MTGLRFNVSSLNACSAPLVLQLSMCYDDHPSNQAHLLVCLLDSINKKNHTHLSPILNLYVWYINTRSIMKTRNMSPSPPMLVFYVHNNVVTTTINKYSPQSSRFFKYLCRINFVEIENINILFSKHTMYRLRLGTWVIFFYVKRSSITIYLKPNISKLATHGQLEESNVANVLGTMTTFYQVAWLLIWSCS